MAITWANTLIDDDGSGTVGTFLNKAQFQAMQANIQDEVDRPYGEIYAQANTVETAIGGAGTHVQVTIFDTNGQSNETTPNHTTDDITLDETGIYLVIVSAHVESIGAGAADLVDLEVRANNGTVLYPGLHSHRKLAGGGGDIGSMSISGLASLTDGDTVELWIANDDNATNLVIADVNLSVLKLKD